MPARSPPPPASMPPPRRRPAAAMLAAAAAALAASAAPAMAAQAVFSGVFVVTSATESCASQRGSTRTMFFSTLVYANNRAALMLTDPYQTITLSPKTASFAASGAYELTQIDRWNGVSTAEGTYSGFAFVPDRITDRTTTLTITGRIKGFAFDKTCTIGFRAVGVRS
jgi:hypothetical protein